MKEIIERLYPINATLLGEGYDERLKILQEYIDLDILEFKTSEEFGTWKVPEEWVIRDAWVKYKGKKIISFKKNPLSLVTYSNPFKGTITKEELIKHLHYAEGVRPHVFKFYDRNWGFCVTEEFKKGLEDGEYEVFVDSEFKEGTMKIGVHTIPGVTNREIVLFAHLDHPYQANDNLSAVACLVDLAKKIKSDYTIKLVFCPETIGSIAYAYSQDISKVEFVIAVDICGNKNSILFQKSFDGNARINKVVHCALQIQGEQYRKAQFRAVIGSDESHFNDPRFGIPGILLTTHPYKEYHTDEDTPDKIHYETIEKVQNLILKIVEIYEKDFVPVRNFSGLLMRSRYGIQSPAPQLNLNYDYFFYSMDGKKSLAELCAEFELDFNITYDNIAKIENDGQISRAYTS